MPGSAATKLSIWASVMISGGASRMTSGAAALTRNPASRAAASASLARGAVSTMPHSSPRPRTWSISGWPQRFDAVPHRLAQHLGAPHQVVVGQHPHHRQRRRGAHRVAAEGAAVQAGRQQIGGGPDGQHAPIGSPAAEALGQGHHVRGDAVVLVGEKGSGAAHSGLHLVEHQQGAVPGRDFACCGQVALGRDDDAALAHDRFQEYRRGVVVDRGGQRVGVAVGHVA